MIAATHPALISWQSGRYTVGLPITPGEFQRLDRGMLHVDWVFVMRRGGGNLGRTTAWEPIIEGDDLLPGFVLDNTFEGGAILLRRVDEG